METIQTLLLILIALSGIPAGILVAGMTREELRPGKRWFKLIAAASLVCIIGSFFFTSGDTLAVALTVFAFTLIISLVPLAYLAYKKKR